MCFAMQDGSVELNVPSTELFPIHHLDDLEFFPCDFVTSASGKGALTMSSCGIFHEQFLVWSFAMINHWSILKVC